MALAVTRERLAFLCPGDGAIDVGANVGLWTREMAAAVGPRGEVMAIEPHPVAYRAVLAFARQYSQVRAIHAGIGALALDAAELYEDRHTERSSLWAANVLSSTGQTHHVPILTLDAIFTLLRVPLRFVKVDAQGAEAAILQGASRTLNAFPRWYIEVWATGLRHAGATVADVLAPFQARGYTVRMGDRTIDYGRAREAGEGQKGHSAVDFWMVPPDADR
mgnify:FL=1